MPGSVEAVVGQVQAVGCYGLINSSSGLNSSNGSNHEVRKKMSKEKNNGMHIYAVAITVVAMGLLVLCVALTVINGDLEKRVLVLRSQVKRLRAGPIALPCVKNKIQTADNPQIKKITDIYRS